MLVSRSCCQTSLKRKRSGAAWSQCANRTDSYTFPPKYQNHLSKTEKNSSTLTPKYQNFMTLEACLNSLTLFSTHHARGSRKWNAEHARDKRNRCTSKRPPGWLRRQLRQHHVRKQSEAASFWQPAFTPHWLIVGQHLRLFTRHSSPKYAGRGTAEHQDTDSPETAWGQPNAKHEDDDIHVYTVPSAPRAGV
jgi:hypothetical protein